MKILKYVVLLLVIIGFALPLQAKEETEIYQWKDAGGITHFTDNLMKVPPKYRKKGKRDIKASKISSAYKKNKQVEKMPVAALASAAVWKSKCVKCHTVGSNMVGKVNLASLAIDPTTRFPVKAASMLPRLKMATDGRFSDMPKIRISADELQQVAEYILFKTIK